MVQRDLDRPENWAGENIKFNKGTCKILHLLYTEGPVGIGDKKTDHEPTMCLHGKSGQQHPALESIVSSSKMVILALYSAVAKPHLECWVQFWVPQFEKVMHLLE